MKSKLAVSTLVAASLFGATTIASAQTESAQPAPGAGVESNSPTAHGASKSSHVKQGTTTGMNSYGAGKARPGGESTARKPAGD